MLDRRKVDVNEMIELNGFRLDFSAATFTAYRKPMSDGDQLRTLREQLADAWFLYWDSGTVSGIPRAEDARPFGEPMELSTDQHLKLLAARIVDVLPYRFPEYQAFRRRPFSFLARKDELVSGVRPQLSAPPILLDCFEIRPEFELDARLMELQDGDAFVGLFMQVHMRWEILAPLDALPLLPRRQRLQAGDPRAPGCACRARRRSRGAVRRPAGARARPAPRGWLDRQCGQRVGALIGVVRRDDLRAS